MFIRSLDLILSSIALVTFLPLFLPVILILKVTGEGEIFFTQKRLGKNGKKFNLLKFATMLKDSPNLGSKTVTLKNDSRVLPFGRFLRKTKLNETPQLLNVFFGNMSLIGPRPQDQRCFNAFPSSTKVSIKKVKPGLSGIGSIIFRCEDDLMSYAEDYDDFYDNVIMPYKGKLEEWFVENNTLKSYILLIFITIWIVLSPSSRIIYMIFPNLPSPPDKLKHQLNYPNRK